MHCSSCGRKISPISRFCKFCGEKIDPKNNLVDKDGKIASPRRFFVISWLVAIAVFIAQIGLIAFLASNKNYRASDLVSSLVLVNIGLGIIFFLAMLISKDRKYFPKNIPAVYTKVWSLVLTYLLIFIIPVLADTYTYHQKKDSVVPTTLPLPTLYNPSPTPTSKVIKKSSGNSTVNPSSGTVDCIGPDGKTFSTSLSECEKLNTSWGKTADYYVNCQVPSNCGGGTRRLKKSECNLSTCCQSGGSYIFTTNSQNCLTKCLISANCGGGYKEMRKSDCDDMTCCQVNNTWILRSKSECHSEQNSEAYSSWVTFCQGLYLNKQTGLYDNGYYSCISSYKN
jgi:hypothetical protein